MKNRIHILLVDDEKRFLETTRKLMERKGYTVFTAPGGAEALECLRTRLVHVVILDVKMPGMDGNQVLQEIKRLYPMTEVILLTGHATIESAIDGLKAGACDYMMKPADLEEVLAKVEEAGARRQALEEKIRVANLRRLERSPGAILRECD